MKQYGTEANSCKNNKIKQTDMSKDEQISGNEDLQSAPFAARDTPPATAGKRCSRALYGWLAGASQSNIVHRRAFVKLRYRNAPAFALDLGDSFVTIRGKVPAEGEIPKMNIEYPLSIRRHMQKVLDGEYDVPYQTANPIILDIGANVGSFALWAIERWPDCHVHCFEPLPDNFELLKRNLRHVTGRVTLNNIAIGDESLTRLFLGRNNCGEASLYDVGEQTDISVEVVTRSPTILPPAHIIKIDTEGAEIDILSRMPAIEYDVVMLEYHGEDRRRQVDALLQDYSLIGGEIRCLHRGSLKYLHRRLINSV